MKNTITPADGEELQRLYAEWPAANERAMNALKMEQPYHRLEGEALARFLEEDAKVGAIVRRIKEILGVAGEAWNA
jgi:hypothetical protein